LKDENGELLVFNSMIDALNFMSEHGYKFLSSHALTMGSTNVLSLFTQERERMNRIC